MTRSGRDPEVELVVLRGRLMAEAGLNVPRILEWEQALGFLLRDIG